MTLAHPAALALLLPAALLLWWLGPHRGPLLWLRAAIVALLIAALAQLGVSLRSGGGDLIVLLDRSRSMPEAADASAAELLGLLDAGRREGDRIAVVTVGAEAFVELPPSEGPLPLGLGKAVDPDGSDLAAGLERAAELLPQDRAGRLLVLSDGLSTGPDPRALARRMGARGVSIDYRWFGRPPPDIDVAVVELEGPAELSEREPFQLWATVQASADVRAELTLKRGGQLVARGQYTLRAGPNRVALPDVAGGAGMVSYELGVAAPGDGQPRNDRATTRVRVQGRPRVLWLTRAKVPGALVGKLREAGLELEVAPPGPLDLATLEGVGAVVLEDVPAQALGERGLRALAQYVEVQGGGLLMTGGRSSFGEGGYRLSPVEDVLPVSLELRQEQRKATLALSLLLDSSCSMGARVPDGRTKMELAAEGAVAALALLQSLDEASVHVVDTEPKEVIPLGPVGRGVEWEKVAGVFTGGGGIYVGSALRSARETLAKSERTTRHVVLFADAADAEEPDDYRETLAELRREGVSVSVIGLGSPTDRDAPLLEEIAALGDGRVYFADDARSLPRMFSQETLLVARASFVETPVGVAAGPELGQLGPLPLERAPPLGGHSVTYLKAMAGAALRTADAEQSPVVALWRRGPGRVAVYTGEVDGPYTGAMRGWDGFAPMLEQLVRWTLHDGKAPLGPVVRVNRDGRTVELSVHADPDGAPVSEPRLLVLAGDGEGGAQEVSLRRVAEDLWVGRWVLPRTGSFHPVVEFGGEVVRAAPVMLPYSPELAPAPEDGGRGLLAELAELSGGRERLSVARLFDDLPDSRRVADLSPYLVALALVLLLLEALGARLGWRSPRRTEARGGSTEGEAATAPTSPRGLPATGPSGSAAGPPGAPAVPPSKASTDGARAGAAGPGVSAALAEARRKARRRTGR